MMRFVLPIIVAPVLVLTLLSGCGPTSVSSGKEDLQPDSKTWIPFAGNESITFKFEEEKMVFTATGMETFYEPVLYKTDQSGFFSIQKDYYADLERVHITFESPSTTYFLSYCLEKNKAETGDWDLLKVTISDNQYYANQLRIITYETDNFNKGKNFRLQATMTLGGKVFNDVYYWKQERRPFEIYYTRSQGVIAFKITSNQLWVIEDSGKVYFD
jgi:hypothetical protein